MKPATIEKSGKIISVEIAFALCMLSYLLGGTVSTLMSVYLPVAIPELLKRNVSEKELGEIGAYLSAAFIFGWMTGGLLLGIVSDRFGRVKTLALSTALYGFFTLMVVFVNTWQFLLVCRFLAGIGVGGVLLISTVYISEIWKESSRPVALGILAVAFPVGIVLAGGLNILFAYWKHAFLLGVLPLVLSVIYLFLLPESEKWLALTKTNYSASDSLFQPSNQKNLWIGSVIFGAVLIGLWAVFSWLPTWVQSLLTGISNGQKERGITMMLLGMGGITGGLFSGMLIRRLGARNTLMFTFMGCLLACGLLFLTNTRFSPVIYAETALLSLFFGVSQGALSSYIPELFPTSIRATATGFCFNIGRFFTGMAVFFVGTLLTVLGGLGNALLVFSATFLVALFAVYVSVKTEAKS